VEVRTKPLILVVDDQATIIRIMTIILRPKYDVCVATSGRKALEVARTQQPDIILLDNMMPEMTGIETCMALKEIPATEHIPVIFITSMDDKHNEQMGFKAGAVDYMNKPPSPELVHARINVHLRNQRQRLFLEKVASNELTDLATIQQTAKLLLEV
jgi:putative two-component system response regulator